VAQKLVDASYLAAVVPSMKPFSLPVYESYKVIPVNDINDVEAFECKEDFVIFGAGKTGMDACNHLMRKGVDPKAIRWIVPNDSYIIDRDYAFGTAERIIDGGQYPMDANVVPKNAKCATLSREEYAALKRVNIVRKGRVEEVNKYTIKLKGG
jgi:hypothetical protein